MNKEWHNTHKMPANPTLDQRIAWHLDHQAHCHCREIPEKLQQEIEKRKAKKKEN